MPADGLCVAHLVRMMAMPAMAVVMSVMVVAFVMMKLTVVMPGSVGMGTMVMMSRMKPGGPLDLLKFGMQHHGPMKRLQVSHG